MENIFKIINFIIGIYLGKVIVNFLNNNHFHVFNVPINKEEIKVVENGNKFKLIID